MMTDVLKRFIIPTWIILIIFDIILSSIMGYYVEIHIAAVLVGILYTICFLLFYVYEKVVW